MTHTNNYINTNITKTIIFIVGMTGYIIKKYKRIYSPIHYRSYSTNITLVL